eukprot:8018810-Prorocentrum_lima.AAC.1
MGGYYGRGQPTQFREGLPAYSEKVPPGWGPNMQVTYPFRSWVVDVKLWDLSTSVDTERRGPFLISQLRGTAKAYMQSDMDKDENVAQ